MPNKTPDVEVENADVKEFLSDPKHEKQRNFMRALFRQMQSEDVEEAKHKTETIGGSFIENFFNGMTGEIFGGKK